MSRVRYDWGKYGNSRVALFNRVMGWVLPCIALLWWPFCIILAMRDWTLIFVPLIFAAPAVMQRIALRQVYRAKPDYAAIARMEREIYGRTFPA